MAEDHVLHWLTALRERSQGVPDITLVEVAKHLGAVDGSQPLYAHYVEPGGLTDSQLDSIVSRVKVEYDHGRASVGEPVGVITGQSFGEAASQATLRTFHYAGVSKGVPPTDVFSKQMGIRQNPYHLAIALAPEYGSSKEEAEKLARGLKKGRLGDVVEIDLASQVYFDSVRDGFSGDRWYQEGDYHEFFPIASELMESGHIAISSDVYSADELDHLIHSILTEKGDPEAFPGLRSKIRFGRVEIEGEERFMMKVPHLGSRLVLNLMDVLADVEICRHCGESFHYLKFQEIGKRVVRESASDEIESISAEEYDSRVRKAEVEYAKEVLETTGWVGNPLDESPSFGSPDWVLGIQKNWSEDPARRRWALAKRDQGNRCRKCGLAWTVDDVQVYQWALPSLGDDYWGEEVEQVIEEREIEIGGGYGRRAGIRTVCYDGGQPGRLVSSKPEYIGPTGWDSQKGMWSNLEKQDKMDLASSRWTLNKEGSVDDQMSYPGDGRLVGQQHDYPVKYLHDGAVINDGRPGEWYIVVRGRTRQSLDERTYPSLLACGEMTKPPSRSKGVDMWPVLPTKGKGSFAGYFALLDGDERFDFMRSSCDCPVQVFHALGIEACRNVWMHNLYGTYSRSSELLEPNKMVSSDSMPIHIKHYMLVVDACCSGITPHHMRGADSSISGNVSAKGSLSVHHNGGLKHYADALSIASYERPLEVLIGSDRSTGFVAMGVTDMLGSMKGQQLVGQGEESREMSPWHTYYAHQEDYDRLVEVHKEIRRIRMEVDEMSRDELDVEATKQLLWWEYIGKPTEGHPLGIEATVRKDVYDRVMAIPGVRDGFKQIGELEIEREALSAIFELDYTGEYPESI